MRRLVVLTLAGALSLPAAAVAAKAPSVQLQVVGKSTLLRAAKPVSARGAHVRVAGRRCTVGTGTPLAALLRTSLKVGLRDYGACGARARDASSLYVRAVAGERGRGQDGWVYKVGGKVPSRGAGDPGARLKGGRQLLWFWCHMGRKGCQRTLTVVVNADAAAPGTSLGVTVVGEDDRGRAVPVAGATVTGGQTAVVTGADGTATLEVPAGSASLDLVATRKGMVQSFPARVQVG